MVVGALWKCAPDAICDDDGVNAVHRRLPFCCRSEDLCHIRCNIEKVTLLSHVCVSPQPTRSLPGGGLAGALHCCKSRPKRTDTFFSLKVTLTDVEEDLEWCLPLVDVPGALDIGERILLVGAKENGKRNSFPEEKDDVRGALETGLVFDATPAARVTLRIIEEGLNRFGPPMRKGLAYAEVQVSQAIADAVVSGGELCVPFVSSNNEERGKIWLNLAVSRVGDRPSELELWIRHHRMVTLVGHTGPILACAIFPSGDKVLTVSTDGTGIIWSSSGTIEATLSGHRGHVIACGVFPSGDKVMTVGEDAMGGIWNANGKQLVVFANLRHAAVFPTGDSLLLFHGTGRGWITSSSGKEFAPLDGILEGAAISAVFPNGDKILVGSENGAGAIWRRDGHRVGTLTRHTSRITSCAVLGKEDQVLTASQDGTCVISSLAGETLVELGEFGQLVTSCMALPPDRFVIGAQDGQCKLYSTTGALLAELPVHSACIASCRAFPGSGRFVTASQDGTGVVWSRDGRKLAVLRGHANGLTCCEVFPSCQWVLTASEDGLGIIWPLALRLDGINNWRDTRRIQDDNALYFSH